MMLLALVAERHAYSIEAVRKVPTAGQKRAADRIKLTGARALEISCWPKLWAVVARTTVLWGKVLDRGSEPGVASNYRIAYVRALLACISRSSNAKLIVAAAMKSSPIVIPHHMAQ
jgi:hypothetical protein